MTEQDRAGDALGLQQTGESKRNSAGRGTKAKFLWRYQSLLLGKRVTIQLGVLTIKAAEEIGKHLDTLFESKRYGNKLDASTIAWLRDADARIVDKLVRNQLCQPVENPLLTDFVAKFIEDKRRDSAERTIINFRQLEKLLKERFIGKRLSDITRRDAVEFWHWMQKDKGLGENTAKRKFGRTREIFTEAIEQGILTENVFRNKKIKVAVGAATKAYIPAEDVLEIIKHCPNTEWKLLFAFGRFVGCRMPSEIQQLTWDDVNREKETILLKSPKTKRFTGKGERLVPIFTEIAGLLGLMHAEVDDGEKYVFPNLRNHSNLATTAKRYVKAAGFVPWSNFWNSLRASRETDLMDEVGPGRACEWIGNSLAVAAKHYQLMRKESFKGTSKIDAKSDAVCVSNDQNGEEKRVANPINTRICDPSSTPSRTRTYDPLIKSQLL